MLPNNQNIPATADDFRTLMTRICRSQRWVADRTGISERRLRYLAAGGRLVSGEFVPTEMSYIEQFALEHLAQAAEIMRLP